MRKIHIVSATAINTPNGVHHLSMCGEDLGAYTEASKTHPVGNYLARTSPHFKRVTCQACKEGI